MDRLEGQEEQASSLVAEKEQGILMKMSAMKLRRHQVELGQEPKLFLSKLLHLSRDRKIVTQLLATVGLEISFLKVKRKTF